MRSTDQNKNITPVQRIERLTEVPMLFLALAYIPLFIVGYLPDVAPDTREAARFAEYFIIAAFAVELLVKLIVAEAKIPFLRTHWLDVVIVVLPFLRPLRFLRFARVFPLLLRSAVGLRRILGPYRGAYVLLVGSLSVFTGAVLVSVFEEQMEGPIQGFGDALWWSVVTVTTVGYGDVTPATLAGRIVAVFLMVVGIALFGMLTAAVAAYFVEDAEEPAKAEQQDQMSEVLAKLDTLERRIEEQNQELRKLRMQPQSVESRVEPESTPWWRRVFGA